MDSPRENVKPISLSLLYGFSNRLHDIVYEFYQINFSHKHAFSKRPELSELARQIDTLYQMHLGAQQQASVGDSSLSGTTVSLVSSYLYKPVVSRVRAVGAVAGVSNPSTKYHRTPHLKYLAAKATTLLTSLNRLLGFVQGVEGTGGTVHDLASQITDEVNDLFSMVIQLSLGGDELEKEFTTAGEQFRLKGLKTGYINTLLSSLTRMCAAYPREKLEAELDTAVSAVQARIAVRPSSEVELQERISGLTQSVETSQVDLAKRESELKKHKAALRAEFESRIAEITERSRVEAERRETALRQQYEGQLSGLQTRLQMAEEQASEREWELEQVRLQRNMHQMNLDGLKEKLASLEVTMQEKDQQTEELQRQREELEGQVSEQTETLAQWDSYAQKVQADYDARNSEEVVLRSQMQALEVERQELIRQAAEMKSHLEGKDEDGMSALLRAVSLNDGNTVIRLLKAGVDPNQADDVYGCSALVLSLTYIKDGVPHYRSEISAEIVQALLEAGADPNVLVPHRRCGLLHMLAFTKGKGDSNRPSLRKNPRLDVVELLLVHGAGLHAGISLENTKTRLGLVCNIPGLIDSKRHQSLPIVKLFKSANRFSVSNLQNYFHAEEVMHETYGELAALSETSSTADALFGQLNQLYIRYMQTFSLYLSHENVENIEDGILARSEKDYREDMDLIVQRETNFQKVSMGLSPVPSSERETPGEVKKAYGLTRRLYSELLKRAETAYKIKLRGEAVTESERLFLDQNLSEAEAKFHKEAPKKGANG